MSIFHIAGQKGEKEVVTLEEVVVVVVVTTTTTFTEHIILCQTLLQALHIVFTHLILTKTLKVGPDMPVL